MGVNRLFFYTCAGLPYLWYYSSGVSESCFGFLFFWYMGPARWAILVNPNVSRFPDTGKSGCRTQNKLRSFSLREKKHSSSLVLNTFPKEGWRRTKCWNGDAKKQGLVCLSVSVCLCLSAIWWWNCVAFQPRGNQIWSVFDRISQAQYGFYLETNI